MALGICTVEHAGHLLVRRGAEDSVFDPRLGASDGGLCPPPPFAEPTRRASPSRLADILDPQEFPIGVPLVFVCCVSGSPEAAYRTTLPAGACPVRRPEVPYK